MLLSLLYIEMFLGEYLTSRKFRPFPLLSSFCLLHHPFIPNTLKPGICVGSTKQPGQYYDYNLTVLNGFEPSISLKSTLRPVPSQLHVAGQKGWKLLSVPGCPTPGALLSDSLQRLTVTHTGWGEPVGSDRDSHRVRNWRLGPGVSQLFPTRALHEGQVCGVARLRCRLRRGSSQAPGGGSNNNC